MTAQRKTDQRKTDSENLNQATPKHNVLPQRITPRSDVPRLPRHL